MAKQTKLQTYTNVLNSVQELLSTAKVTKGFTAELLQILETNLAPKSGGGSINPPILNDEGEIVEAWCRFHKQYEEVGNMVMSTGKSKGYCKASISLWNKTNSKIKALDSKAVEAMSNGDFESAQAIAQEAQGLKESFNSAEFYNYERDWDEFNK